MIEFERSHLDGEERKRYININSNSATAGLFSFQKQRVGEQWVVDLWCCYIGHNMIQHPQLLHTEILNEMLLLYWPVSVISISSLNAVELCFWFVLLPSCPPYSWTASFPSSMLMCFTNHKLSVTHAQCYMCICWHKLQPVLSAETLLISWAARCCRPCILSFLCALASE